MTQGPATDWSTFWEEAAQVERFAGRPADHRLVEICDRHPEPHGVAVLDLGCAGGRNTALLAERGFDFHALDSSRAMVAHTRERVAAIVGEEEAERRVVLGDMDDLSAYADGSFDRIVALGIFHQAGSLEAWHRAVAEARRVLGPGGQILYAGFSPRSQPGGKPMAPVADRPHVYEWATDRHVCLLEADELDAAMAGHDLVPASPTETVEVALEKGFRRTVNALYAPP